MKMSNVSEKLIAAYRQAEFKTESPSIRIKVGENTPKLDLILEVLGETTWAFITAHNPFSVVHTDEDNELRHKQLVSLLHYDHTLEGYGYDKEGFWKPEKSLLVIGISKQKASEIGVLFEQNAIVTGELGEPADLAVLF
jgi:hypothetical protein